MELNGIWPVVLPFFVGWVISSNLPASGGKETLMRALIALPFGFAIVSLLSFLTLLLSSMLTYSYVFEGALILCAAAFLIYRGRWKSAVDTSLRSEKIAVYYVIPLVIVFFLILATFVQTLKFNPHGGWDAWAIWNLRAKFLFKNEAFWKDAFSSYIPWSHPDYPLLLPLTVSRWWKYLGLDSVSVPQAVAFVFTFSTLILLFYSVSHFKGTIQGVASVLAISMAFCYLKNGAQQYADIPIGFFFLSASVFVVNKDTSDDKNRMKFLILSGLCLGFAAWTKNEGLIFITAFMAARLVIFLLTSRLREFLKEIPYFLAGMAQVLIPLIIFKFKFALPNDVLSSFGQDTINKFADIGRYYTILKSFILLCIPYGEINFGFAFLTSVAFLIVSGITQVKKYLFTSAFLVLTLLFMLIGDFFVFVVIPYDVNFTVATLLYRLISQILPLGIFAVFLLSASMSEREII
ncbi:MAG: hypothetical protein HQK92_10840 [Nitrospirae bacterium]|nr:hypothetical protein [Nitrospirota bacterium]